MRILKLRDLGRGCPCRPGWEDIFRMNQKQLEAAIRRVSNDPTLEPQARPLQRFNCPPACLQLLWWRLPAPRAVGWTGTQSGLPTLE